MTLAYKSVIDRDKWLAIHPGSQEPLFPFAVGDVVENSPRGGFHAWPTLAAVPLSWFDDEERRILEIEYDEADRLRAHYNAYVRVSRLRVVREVSREEHPKFEAEP